MCAYVTIMSSVHHATPRRASLCALHDAVARLEAKLQQTTCPSASPDKRREFVEENCSA